MNDPASAAQQQPQDRGGADVHRHGSLRSSASAAGGAPASTAGGAPAPAGVSEGGYAHSHDSGHAHSHDSGHGHSHGHSHSHAPTDAPLRALLIVLGVTGTVFFAELIGGLITGSVALLADAMHMLSDAAGLIIAVVAIFIGRRSATAQATFGYRRVEVLAALVNACLLYTSDAADDIALV